MAGDLGGQVGVGQVSDEVHPVGHPEGLRTKFKLATHFTAPHQGQGVLGGGDGSEGLEDQIDVLAGDQLPDIEEAVSGVRFVAPSIREGLDVDCIEARQDSRGVHPHRLDRLAGRGTRNDDSVKRPKEVTPRIRQGAAGTTLAGQGALVEADRGLVHDLRLGKQLPVGRRVPATQEDRIRPGKVSDRRQRLQEVVPILAAGHPSTRILGGAVVHTRHRCPVSAAIGPGVTDESTGVLQQAHPEVAFLCQSFPYWQAIRRCKICHPQQSSTIRLRH